MLLPLPLFCLIFFHLTSLSAPFLLARPQLWSQSSVLHSLLAPSGLVIHLYSWRAPHFLPPKVKYQASCTNFFLLPCWLVIWCPGSFAHFYVSGQKAFCYLSVHVWSVSNVHLRGDARPRRDRPLSHDLSVAAATVCNHSLYLWNSSGTVRSHNTDPPLGPELPEIAHRTAKALRGLSHTGVVISSPQV